MGLLWLDFPGWLLHDTGPGHPERGQRYTSVQRALKALNPDYRQAEEISDLALLRLHPESYVHHVEKVCMSGPASLHSADTMVVPASWEAARRGAGAAVEGARVALEGTPVFAGVRPPGHHAERQVAMGFCLFNNAALAALEARAQGAERVAIFDFDVHHGNGTQHAFEDDPSVLYVSTHQWPFYPGTGDKNETGRGAGEGSTLNVPLSAGTDDEDYRQAFSKIVAPALKNFAPDLLIFSAGFDAHHRDPLGGFNLTSAMFGEITEGAMEAAFPAGSARVLSLLEGGYDLEALEEAIPEHLKVLS